jgi:hypothetical protein
MPWKRMRIFSNGKREPFKAFSEAQAIYADFNIGKADFIKERGVDRFSTRERQRALQFQAMALPREETMASVGNR